MNKSEYTPPKELLAPEFDKPVTHSVLLDAIILYRQHFRLFASIVVLPTFAGVLFLWASQSAVARLIQSYKLSSVPDEHLRATLHSTHIVLEATLIHAAGFFGVWLCWVFAFVGVTVAVRQILNGDVAEPEECLNSVRERPLNFLTSSASLFVEMWILAFFIGEFVFMASLQIAEHMQVPLTSIPGIVFGYIEVVLIAALTLPLLLALPATILEDQTLIPALKKSFALTEGKSLVMLGLFLESELSSSIVALFLSWATYFWRNGYGEHVMQGSIGYVEIIISAFLQPIAMIGFGWIYVTRTRELAATEAEHAQFVVSDSDEG